ncbi:MAG: nucleotidyltransferase family protein [Betaproteobacteria bacterium]
MSPSADDRQLIIECLRWFARGARGRDAFVPAYDIGRVDWRWLLPFASRQRIVPFVLRFLDETGQSEALPLPFLGLFRITSAQYADHFRTQIAEYVDLLREMDGAGFETMPLKGMALALGVYRDLPFRPMRDVDVLVHPSDLPRLCRWLGARGFDYPLFQPDRWRGRIRRRYFQLALADPSGGCFDTPFNPFGAFNPLGRESLVRGPVRLDLHWKPAYVAGEDGVVLDAADFWRSSRDCPELGVHARLPSVDALLHHLLIHLGDFYRPTLAQLLDCALVVRSDEFLEPGVHERFQSRIAGGPALIRRLVDAVLDLGSEALSAEELLARHRELFDGFFVETHAWADETPARTWLRSVRLMFGGGRKLWRYGNGVGRVGLVRDGLLCGIGYLLPEPGFYPSTSYWNACVIHWRERRVALKIRTVITSALSRS